MNLIVIIIVSLLLVPTLVIGLIVFIETRRRQIVRTKLQGAIDQLAKDNQLLILEAEFFRDKVIGLDEIEKQLVFAHVHKNGLKTLCLALNSISFCRVTKMIDKSSSEVSQIFIQVNYKECNQSFRLNFYNRAYDDPRAKQVLLDKARYWKDRITKSRQRSSFNNQFENVS